MGLFIKYATSACTAIRYDAIRGVCVAVVDLPAEVVGMSSAEIKSKYFKEIIEREKESSGEE